MSYIERQSGQQIERPTHWLRGQLNDAASLRADEIDADDILDHPAINTTPASLFKGVFYLLDRA